MATKSTATKSTPSSRRRSTTTTKKKAAPAVRRRSTAASKSLEIVVRRGAMRRFDALKTQTTELPVVVTWDRRTSDRRDTEGQSDKVARDRRAVDRRQKPPFTWDLADFVVVAAPGASKKGRKKTAKKR
jgi:hypothetical protein